MPPSTGEDGEAHSKTCLGGISQGFSLPPSMPYPFLFSVPGGHLGSSYPELQEGRLKTKFSQSEKQDGCSAVLLCLFIPQAELLLGHVVIKTVGLLAAADATLVRGCLSSCVSALAILQHAGIPLNVQGVAADARLPTVCTDPAMLQAR